MRILYVVGNFSVVEPMGVLQLSAVTRAAGHESFLAALDEGDVLNMIERHAVDVAALSFMTTEAADFRRLAETLKNRYPNLAVIAGGPHPTYFPKIADQWSLDAVILGEGDLVMVPLLEALAGRRDLKTIPGVHTREFKNPPGPLVQDLDSLPFADRELIADMEPFKHVRMRSFFATRGCPFACAYCFNSAFSAMHKGQGGKILRRRSVENLIREIEAVKALMPLDFVRFGDDAFILQYDAWAEEFCREYRRRINLPFYFLIHPNCVDEKLVKAVRAAGCHSVMMGLESGNPELRARVLGRTVADAQMSRAFDLFRAHGVKVFSNTILGLPDSTLEDDLYSLEFTLDRRPYYSGFTVFTPFPGTLLGEEVLRKGCVDHPELFMDAFPSSMQQSSVLKHVTPRQKEIHRNILALAPMANMFPFLRGLVTKKLIYWKPNACFDALGFLVRNYCNMNVWPFRKSLGAFVSLVGKVMRIDRKNYAAVRADGMRVVK